MALDIHVQGSEAPRRDFDYYLGPPIIGAATLFMLTSLRVLIALPAIIGGKLPWTAAALALATATLAGFCGGVVYVLLGRSVKQIPYIGPYLAGIITIGAYMGAIALAAPYAFGEQIIHDRGDVLALIGLSVFMGLVGGYAWSRVSSPAARAADEEVDRRLRPLVNYGLPITAGAFFLLLRSNVGSPQFELFAVGIVLALVVAWILLRRTTPTSAS